ncbi:MAG: hypothetical protein EPN53_02020 [Acidobacteria bacterium]|nr:MAG: hypothetical protein EPN53_02020 [Acidobacteriota bacterium]
MPSPAADRVPSRPITVVSIDMGYGHLRAAHALADALATPVLEIDRAPLAGPGEEGRWRRVRVGYEALSRLSQVPLLGRPTRRLLEAITAIPHLHPHRDQSPPTAAVRWLERLARSGVGEGLVAHLRATGATLLTTFYAPAVIADLAGAERIVCVVTDADLNRVWVPRDPGRSRIHYAAPSERAGRRLRAYGVPPERIHLTGFPLPGELLGGTDLEALRQRLAARLVRLDPAGAFRAQLRDELAHLVGPLPVDVAGEAPLVTFAVGGAGAQAGMARALLRSLSTPILAGTIRLALVAGVRAEVAASFRLWAENEGLAGRFGNGLEILCEDTVPAYLARFNRLLERTDVLWTKPSELTFFAALGIPLVFARPVGVHERLNRRWAIQRGAGLKQDDPRHAAEWLREWLDDGTLAATAWSGYVRLPKFGTPRVIELARSL